MTRYAINYAWARDRILELLDDELAHSLEEIRALAPRPRQAVGRGLGRGHADFRRH